MTNKNKLYMRFKSVYPSENSHPSRNHVAKEPPALTESVELLVPDGDEISSEPSAIRSLPPTSCEITSTPRAD
jgi:hypothetical protein